MLLFLFVHSSSILTPMVPPPVDSIGLWTTYLYPEELGLLFKDMRWAYFEVVPSYVLSYLFKFTFCC